MKLISWNVNGLRACVGKGFLEFFKKRCGESAISFNHFNALNGLVLTRPKRHSG